MLRSLIRTGSFFGKELNEVRRQPRLVLSLVFGPFLILALFGVGYMGDQPVLRTALVAPEGSLAPAELQVLTSTLLLNFQLTSVVSDQNAPLEQLQRGQLDLVQILPNDIEGRVRRNEQAPVAFAYREINPINERWIQYLAYAQVNEMNRALLLRTISGIQGEAATTQERLAQARADLDQLNNALPMLERQRIQNSLRQVRGVVDTLALNPLLLRQVLAPDRDPEQVRNELLQTRNDLDVIDQAISEGRIEQQRERIATISEQIKDLEAGAAIASTIAPQVLVSPLKEQYQNLNRSSFNLMTYYTPGVLALLIQHIAVTLGALSLVRERLIGSVELFRVAPVNIGQLLIGKYLSYTFFIGVVATVLLGLMPFLGVPVLGNPLTLAGLLLLLTLASLGVGFLISAISRSDSQAIQFSMLVLLLSIFFSGFLLPLENFWSPIRVTGYILPLTHGIVGLQAALLQGLDPGPMTWAALGSIAAVTFLAVVVAGRRVLNSVF